MPLGEPQVVVGGRARPRGLQQIAPGRRDQRRSGDGAGSRQVPGSEQRQPGLLLRAQRGRVERRTGQVQSRAGGLQRAPSGAGGQRLLRFVVGVRQPGGVGGIDVRARQRGRQPGRGLFPGRSPVRAVHRRGVGLQRPVRLQPAELAAGFQRDVLQLRTGQACLDLGIAAGAGLGEPLLPAPPGPPRPPQEELAAAQGVGGGLHQAAAVHVEGGDPAAGAVGHRVEVVGGELAAQRIGPVGAVGVRYRDAAQGPFVAEVPGLLGGGQDTGVLVLGHGGVGPPVDRHGVMVRIADPDAHVEEVGAVGQPQVHLEGQIAQPLPLPQPQHLPAVRRRDTGGVQRGAGEGGVAGGTDVPFDAAGEPGAVEREGRGLQHRVAVEQFTVGGLVVQGVHPAAETGQDGGAQPVVLDDQRVEVRRAAGAPVAVAHPGRQDRPQRRIPDLPGHVGGQAGVLGDLDTVQVVAAAQGGEGVVGSEGGGGEGQGGASHSRGHGCLAMLDRATSAAAASC